MRSTLPPPPTLGVLFAIWCSCWNKAKADVSFSPKEQPIHTYMYIASCLPDSSQSNQASRWRKGDLRIVMWKLRIVMPMGYNELGDILIRCFYFVCWRPDPTRPNVEAALCGTWYITHRNKQINNAMQKWYTSNTNVLQTRPKLQSVLFLPTLFFVVLCDGSCAAKCDFAIGPGLARSPTHKIISRRAKCKLPRTEWHPYRSPFILWN